jgi:hypothetical protein
MKSRRNDAERGFPGFPGFPVAYLPIEKERKRVYIHLLFYFRYLPWANPQAQLGYWKPRKPPFEGKAYG